MPDYMFGRKNADARDHDGGLAGWAVVALVFMPFAGISCRTSSGRSMALCPHALQLSLD